MKLPFLPAALVLSAACQPNDPTYFPPAAPLEVGQQGGMAAASSTVTIAFRRPSDEERQSLREEGRKQGHDLPWLRTDRVAVSLLYTITSLGDRRGTAQLSIDGASEFASYDAAALRAAAEMAAAANEDEQIYLSLIEPKPLTVEPGQTVSGIIGEDDFAEAALDLDAISRWMATPAAVLINRHEMNPVGLERVPANLVPPALFRVQVSFAATMHMRLEFLVRVRDEEGQLRRGEGQTFSPQPRAYAPPAPMMMPGMMMPAGM